MIKLEHSRTACVAIDMHRGHLDPEIATLPLAAERCGPVITRANSSARSGLKAFRSCTW
ncbi:MAG TPA: hypothetical protein VLX09_22880 [Stellaceae bacterium]|nr:hypothetical protein [Stellaceae bacterium]